MLKIKTFGDDCDDDNNDFQVVYTTVQNFNY